MASDDAQADSSSHDEGGRVWFHFLLARWDALPEDIRQKVMTYDIWRTIAQLQTCHPAFFEEVRSLERALKQVARRYGWDGDKETGHERIHPP